MAPVHAASWGDVGLPPAKASQLASPDARGRIEKGTLRAAVDGVEIVRYTQRDPGERKDPEKRIIPGPIGMFRHGSGASEYKDIYLEVDPKDDKLLTVK